MYETHSTLYTICIPYTFLFQDVYLTKREREGALIYIYPFAGAAERRKSPYILCLININAELRFFFETEKETEREVEKPCIS